MGAPFETDDKFGYTQELFLEQAASCCATRAAASKSSPRMSQLHSSQNWHEYSVHSWGESSGQGTLFEPALLHSEQSIGRLPPSQASQYFLITSWPPHVSHLSVSSSAIYGRYISHN